MKKIFYALLIIVAVAGCRRTDVRDFTVHVPEMREKDVERITRELFVFNGVVKESVKVDMNNRIITLKYDSMQIAKKNIEMAIAKIGLTANGVKPESIGTNID